MIVRLYMRAKGLISMVELNNVDSERARELAEARLREQVSRLTNNEVLEAGNRLNEQYVLDTHHNAKIMGMGMTANGMKGLIQEIQTLLQQAKTLIDQLPKPKNRE
ncbi:hypothetical protein D3C71_1915800 [compost metagenome]